MAALGGIGPLILVYKVTTSIHIVDVHTMRTHEIDSSTYHRHEFKALCSKERMTEYIVLNIEDVDFDFTTSRAAAKNKFRMIQVEVARKSEFGKNDTTFIVNTHLGEFLNFQDTVFGYDIQSMMMSEIDDFERANTKVMLPDVVLVRKAFPKTRKR